MAFKGSWAWATETEDILDRINFLDELMKPLQEAETSYQGDTGYLAALAAPDVSPEALPSPVPMLPPDTSGIDLSQLPTPDQMLGQGPAPREHEYGLNDMAGGGFLSQLIGPPPVQETQIPFDRSKLAPWAQEQMDWNQQIGNSPTYATGEAKLISPAETHSLFNDLMTAQEALTTSNVGESLLNKVGVDVSGLPAPLRLLAEQGLTPVNYLPILAGPKLGASLAGEGVLANIAKSAVEPMLEGPLLKRAAVDLGLNALGQAGAEQVGQRLPEDTPWYLRVPATLGAGGLAAGAGLGAIHAAPSVGRAAVRGAEKLGPEVERLIGSEAGQVRIGREGEQLTGRPVDGYAVVGEVFAPDASTSKAALTRNQARTDAAKDILSTLNDSTLSVADQMDAVAAEMTAMQEHVFGRQAAQEARQSAPSAPKFGSPEREEWDAQRRMRTQPSLSSPSPYAHMSWEELQERIRVFDNFLNTMSVEPVTEGTVKQADLFGNVQDTFATEAEKQGYRETQAPLMREFGAQSTETAGPLFQQPDTVAAAVPKPPEGDIRLGTGGKQPIFRASATVVNIADELATKRAALRSASPVDASFFRREIADLTEAANRGRTEFTRTNPPPVGYHMVQISGKSYYAPDAMPISEAYRHIQAGSVAEGITPQDAIAHVQNMPVPNPGLDAAMKGEPLTGGTGQPIISRRHTAGMENYGPPNEVWVGLYGKPLVRVSDRPISDAEAIAAAERHWVREGGVNDAINTLRSKYPDSAVTIEHLPGPDKNVVWNGDPGEYVVAWTPRRRGGAYQVRDAIPTSATMSDIAELGDPVSHVQNVPDPNAGYDAAIKGEVPPAAPGRTALERVTGAQLPYATAVGPKSESFVTEHLNRVGEGNPGVTTTHIPADPVEGAGERYEVAYRDPSGKPVAYMELVGTNNGLVVDTMVADPSAGLLKGRAVASLLKEADRLGVSGVGGTVTPDAQRLIDRVTRMRQGAPDIAELGDPVAHVQATPDAGQAYESVLKGESPIAGDVPPAEPPTNRALALREQQGREMSALPATTRANPQVAIARDALRDEQIREMAELSTWNGLTLDEMEVIRNFRSTLNSAESDLYEQAQIDALRRKGKIPAESPTTPPAKGETQPTETAGPLFQQDAITHVRNTPDPNTGLDAALKGNSPSDTVRLFRAEPIPGSGKPVADWIVEGKQAKGITEAEGRWFTDKPEILDWYMNDIGPENARVVYVDVPKNEVEQFRVSNLGGTPARYSRDAKNEFFVSKDIADTKQPLTRTEVINDIPVKWTHNVLKGEMPDRAPKGWDYTQNMESARRQLRWLKANPSTPELSSYGSAYMRYLPESALETNAVEMVADLGNRVTNAREVASWLTRKGEDFFGPGAIDQNTGDIRRAVTNQRLEAPPGEPPRPPGGSIPPRGPGEPPAEPPRPPSDGGIPPRGPGEPPVTPGGSIPPTEPSRLGENVIGLRNITPGLTRNQERLNAFKSTIGRLFGWVPDDPYAAPAMAERARVKESINSNAARLGSQGASRVSKAFEVDKHGGIAVLDGIDPAVPGAPTIQDVAARYPIYEHALTPGQRGTMEWLRQQVEPYQKLLSETGIDVHERNDIMNGGFYLPRGRADIEGADEALKVYAGGSRGGKKGFEKVAVFNSMAEGIDKGYKYSSLGDSLNAFARNAGQRATDAHIANYFKSITDDEGKLISQTAADRINPDLRSRVEGLRTKIAARADTILRQETRGKAQTAEAERRGADVDRLVDMTAKAERRTGRQFWADATDDAVAAAQRELRILEREEDYAIKRASQAGERADKTNARYEESRAAVSGMRDELDSLSGEWDAAKRKAQQMPRGYGAVGLPGLQGYAFPDAIANAVNNVIKDEGIPTGHGAIVLRMAHEYNKIYRQWRANFDDSAIGVQGLLFSAKEPRAAAEAMKVNAKAWVDPHVLGAFMQKFDNVTSAEGRLSSQQWAKHSLHIGGAETEFSLTAIEKIPVVNRASTAANRAFGYYGDAARLSWADNELKRELAKGRTLPEIIASGDIDRIAKAVNGATGYNPSGGYASWHDLITFAPGFFQSRLDTLARAAAGMRPGAPIEQRIARNGILKLIGFATAMTVAANVALGNETDFQPFKDGRLNSNFMRVRFANKDWSLFGTWDSLARLMVATATGHPQDSIRGLASGTVATAWDLISGTSYTGEPVRDNPEHFARWIMNSALPFVASDLPSTVQYTAEGVKSLNPGKVATGITAAAGQILGGKQSPMTPSELRDVAREDALKRLQAEGKIDSKYQSYDQVGPIERDLIDNQPEVSRHIGDIAGNARERGSGYQAYKDEVAANNSDFADTVERRAKSLGYGKALREAISNEQSLRIDRNENTKKRHGADLEFLNNMDPRQNPMDVALQEYMATVNDPSLEDPNSGEFNYQERDRRLKGLKTKYGDAMIASVEKYIHENEPPIVKELREDREKLSGYWKIADQMFQRYGSRSREMRQFHSYAEMQGALARNDAKALRIKQDEDYKDMVAEISERRDDWAERNRVSAKLLYKWGYRTVSEKAAERGLVPSGR